MSPWDSVGSYLELGPSAHNGNANWATKCGKNSPRVKYVCTGKSPACQISLLYHSLFPLLLLHHRLLMLLWSAIHALPTEPKFSKKNSNMDRSLSLSSDITISLKVGLIGCYRILVQSGNRQNGRVGTFPCHSQDGSMRLLASAPWQRCTTDECRLIGLLQMEMAIAYNPIPAL